MESLRRKRKGLAILPLCVESLIPSTVIWSHLSPKDYSRQKRKCKENEGKEVGIRRSLVKSILTAPHCRNSSVDPPCRGLKRKFGWIEVVTQLGRKQKIEQHYDLGASIGQGKFGSVVLCRNKVTGVEFACKILRKGEDLVHREVEIMQHLSGHPGIVNLKAVYEDAELYYLVMELCSGGQLLHQMAREGQYSEHRAANIIRELVLVIKYCQEMGVVHRDIKPENILLTASGKMKLADFGLSVRITNGQKITGLAGSPAYVAPEILFGDYSDKVDIWSAGVLLYALLVGVLPFQGDSFGAVCEAIKNVKLDFESGIWESVSQPAKDLVSRMLTRDVSARLTANEILRHPWILFYTEPALEGLALKSKFRNHVTLTSQKLTVAVGVEEWERCNVTGSSFFSDDSSLVLTSGDSRIRLDERDFELADVLAMAISRVRISEPKRSRLCVGTSLISQECSSNIKVNNLCTAF
ncbi:serine/threonine-protein kinase PEPKR2-like [Euphorbia lathyris]|uniref:serine/threonine-protein kinase PEPKR2-like n=1 Tax=Euphorbia lathyris TaxID=212925 RepID=UPI003313CA2D